MGFMISFDGRATLTSDERHSPERYRTNGRTIDTFSRKNTVNARYLWKKNLHKTAKKRKKQFLDWNYPMDGDRYIDENFFPNNRN